MGVARGENGKAGLREGTGKICLKVPHKGGKQCAIVNFEKGVYSILKVLHN